MAEGDVKYKQKSLEGIPQRDQALEAEFPALRQVFNSIILKDAPEDIYRELKDDQVEFPIKAILAEAFSSDEDREDDVFKFRTTHGSKSMGVLARSGTSTNSTHNSLNHAEKNVIELSLDKLQSKHLKPNSILISTVEPCAMCASAFIHAGGSTIIYGISQRDLRGEYVMVNGTKKYFRTEPEDYHIEKFVRDRNPAIRVFGGYQRDDVLKYTLNLPGPWKTKA